MSSENKSKPISSENEEDDCSEAESDIQHGTCTKAEKEKPRSC